MSEPHSIPADNEKAWEDSDNLVLKQNYAASIQDASVDDHGIPVPAVMEKIIDRYAPPASPEEDRYEHIELIVKTRPGSPSWFDVIHDYITQDCDSVQIDPDDEDSDWTPCSCGMESMGGMTGTLQQCFDHTTNLGQGIQPIDVARVIIFLTNPASAPYVSPADRVKIINWAHKEVEFEAYFENREWENEDE